MSPRVSFVTLGCRLNQAETAQMAASFEAGGYSVVRAGEGCDVLVVHGCAVTGEAERQSHQLVRRAARAIPRPLVVLAGCPADVPSPAGRAAAADLVVGRSAKFDLPALVDRLLGIPPRPLAAPSGTRRPPRFETARAWVKVQDGCAFRCTYCIVPILRGQPRSRPAAEVLEEVALLAAAGHREIVLTGANVGCYRDGDTRLPELLVRAADVRGIDRIRLSSIEPTTTEREVIDVIAACPRLCRFLHMPLQSGDNALLAAMGRRYTAERFAETVAYAFDRIPLLGLGTDILAGFPGETESAFRSTLALVERLPVGNLHVFPYSPRPGTRAPGLADPVPARVARARASQFIALGARRRADFAARFAGRTVDVLPERRLPDGMVAGWTSEYLEARLPGSCPLGRVVPARVERVEDAVLHATPHPRGT